jgi:hypothetical protein
LKSTCALLLALFLFVSSSAVQIAAAQSSARTDVYHVHFAKSALGKAAEEADYLKQGDPKAPMAGHQILLRHQSGEDWDYAQIEHLGTKATIEAAGTPVPAGARDLNAWHSDTFVNGPAWPEFAKALGLDDPAKSAGSVYVVAVFRAAPGHREELEKALAQPGTGAAGNVLLQHLEGAPWHFLTVIRYNSWEDFAKGEKADAANTSKPDSGWVAIRNHSSNHNDTITDRIAP